MANGLERESGSTIFSEEELREVSGVKRVGDYVEVTCGCTSHRYGDAVGRLRVFVNGYLEITCECTPGCQEAKLTPSAFEKHSGRETARKWKNNVWVIVNGEKVPLCKTVLLKYYNQVSKAANGSHRSQNGRACHRDEFVRCSRCNKERRFRLSGNVLIFHMTKLHVMMKRKEQVVEFTGDALVLQHAKVALLVSVLAVISAAFQSAVARLVLTLQTMPKLDSFILYAIFYFLTC
ncbi:hypothetical protein LR48_Vigan08g111500 [Vigna angularis]|uniref:SAND domain-containing protein n=1 Tax=Phaseolus angularis TaxID=3914 RepID=A0A0L9V5M7_PHAAN|nr:hypothetical protein LR48_Vigan08g111500 [Vigna angularis]